MAAPVDDRFLQPLATGNKPNIGYVLLLDQLHAGRGAEPLGHGSQTGR